MTSKPAGRRALSFCQAFFYIAFVVLWFKDNFPALKPIRVPALWAFVPLIGITLLRLVRWAGAGRPAAPADWKRTAAAIGLILGLTTITHLPFLTHSFGLMDSDEAIPALMSKHIAEGRQPPLFFYGAFFQGSLPQHYTAAFFKLFGYSVPLAKWTAFLAFALFLVVQFFLIKKAFPFGFACATGLFYVLPWQESVRASLDLASGFTVVLLLGGLAFTLTAGLVYEGKKEWLGPLGFVLGLAFWSHQISIIFCAAVAPFLISKLRTRIGDYLKLGVSFLIGALPLLLNEVLRGFPVVKVFFLGQSGNVDGSRFRHAWKFLAVLISAGPPAASQAYLGLMALGLAAVVALVLKRRAERAALIFPVYFLAFMAVYLLSDSSGTYVIRYLYILYIVVPVLLGAPFLWLKSWARFAAAAIAFLLVFAASQAGASRALYRDVKTKHQELSATVAAMTSTGERYWISDFWTSYLLTSLSGEKLVVASKDVRRYYPYELLYWSAGRNNWVIARNRDASEHYGEILPQILNRVGVAYERAEVGGFTLIHRIGQDVFPRVFLADPPEDLPDVSLAGVSAAGGALNLEFVREDSRPSPGVGLRLEIPGYCARPFPIWERGRLTARLPFPLEEKIRLRSTFTYAGFALERSARESAVSLGPAELGQPRPEIEFLEGIGPQREAYGRPMFACRKAAVLEVNRPADGRSKLILDLYSPFDFKEPFWYGDYAQSVAIAVNGRDLGERILGEGKTTVALDLEPGVFTGRGDIVRLEFKYAMPVSFSENFRTAAYLERAAFE